MVSDGVACFVGSQIVTSAWRTPGSVTRVSASTRWEVTAASAPTGTKPPGTSPCVWVSSRQFQLRRRRWVGSELNLSAALWFQTWTSATGSPAGTAPVRTQWAPTTVCVTPASRTPTTGTA